VLVNNAGISTFEPKIPQGVYDWKDIDFDIDVNYKECSTHSAYRSTHMKHGEGGYWSARLRCPVLFPSRLPHVHSLKMAVVTLMEELAIELEGTGVGSAAFCPGPYSTNLG
jgi:NAD(P)-dependent dehydrogenase (short-subunit alcohol dehydrogenase family)